MIFPDDVTQPLSLKFVATAFGFGPPYSLGSVCTNQGINKWARFRPGFWTYENGKLVFQLPKGGAYTDPRGVDPNTGSNAQAYKLGDFRKYNSNAPAVGSINGDEVISIPSSQTDAIQYTLGFLIGEVDWKGSEVSYHGRNAIPLTFTHFVVKCDQLANSENHGMIFRTPIPETSLNEYNDVQASVSLSVPTSSGTSKTYVFQYGLGTGNSALFAGFGVESNIRLEKRYNPFSNFTITEEMYPIMRSKAMGISAGDSNMVLYNVLVNNGVKSLNIGDDKVSITGLSIILYLKTPDASRDAYYDMITNRWNISGYVQYWDGALGVETGRYPFSVTMSGNSSGELSGIINLGTRANDGFTYNIIVTDCGIFNVTKQS